MSQNNHSVPGPPRCLVDYGIQNEKSDIRAHVCPVVRRVYVYPTSCGIDILRSGRYVLVDGFQEGVDFPTAKGYLVPPFDIAKCASIALRKAAWAHIGFRQSDTTSLKGKKAVRLVMGMIRAGLLPIPAMSKEIDAQDIQIAGMDIIIKAGAITKDDIRIQVKCDFLGGDRLRGGTGNLFLQIQECNPNKQY